MGDHKLKTRMQTKILQENANILETPFFFIAPYQSLFFGRFCLAFRKTHPAVQVTQPQKYQPNSQKSPIPNRPK